MSYPKRFLLFIIFCGLCLPVFASELDQQLYETSLPYIKYYADRACGPASEFPGLTRSFQLSLGGNSSDDEKLINYGAVAYDQSLLARIQLAGGITTILDTYVSYFKNHLSDPNNPLLNCNGNYYDASHTSLKYGAYRVARILGREIPGWYTSWDWIVDTGAAACLIVDSLEAYQKTLNTDYRNFAVLLGDYLLRLKDTDGGIRYGPRGMFHYPEPQSDFYWNLKSTEQNERALSALKALSTVTGFTRFTQAATALETWLKGMYNFSVHLFHSAATYNGSTWDKTGFGYVATDVMAFAPLELMASDTYFGSSQSSRDAEIDAMFSAIESRTAFFDAADKPIFFKFSVSQSGAYGSVEFSSQMALAYLRMAQLYSSRGEVTKAQSYLDKYYTLVDALSGYFSYGPGDSSSLIAPYASYLNGSVAGGVPTGTGYSTYYCEGALASAYYVFAKAGYLPGKLGGGSGIPQIGSTLNLSGVPWYQNTVYTSSGAAACQMILNYIREGAGAALLSQNEVYNYARLPAPLGPELVPSEVQKALGYFDPYDTLISNRMDWYTTASGNPFKGYNFTIRTYDPATQPSALNAYMRDICHWMAYTVVQDYLTPSSPLVARPHTPAVLPIYGTYNHWVVIKGYAASANPCPEPRTNPFQTPDFTVYGFWMKDPLTNGIGKDTYKTAVECAAMYFQPLATGDAYQGKFLHVAEPPSQSSGASARPRIVLRDPANLEFLSAHIRDARLRSELSSRAQSLRRTMARMRQPWAPKRGWQDILDKHMLVDPEVTAAFSGTQAGEAVVVRRMDASGADYYLLPFGKYDRRHIFLTHGVIVLDARDGHFKEASWSSAGQRFLPLTDRAAESSVRHYLAKEYTAQLKLLPRRGYAQAFIVVSRAYAQLLSYLRSCQTQLVWGRGAISASVYQPYWKVDANGYVWYVDQDGKVTAQTDFSRLIQEISLQQQTLRSLLVNR